MYMCARLRIVYILQRIFGAIQSVLSCRTVQPIEINKLSENVFAFLSNFGVVNHHEDAFSVFSM